MYCKFCGRENDEDAKKCVGCDKPLHEKNHSKMLVAVVAVLLAVCLAMAWGLVYLYNAQRAVADKTEAVSAFDKKPCCYCADENHTGNEHPKCVYCSAMAHSSNEHPKCAVCGSTSHTEHPKCAVCGSTSHVQHPMCGICGSTSHADKFHENNIEFK